MCNRSEWAYHAQREKAERLAAERATIPAARNIHTVLADRYATMALSHEHEPREPAR